MVAAFLQVPQEVVGALPASASAVPPGPGQFFGARARVLNNVSIAAGATSTVKVAGAGTVPATGVSAVAVEITGKGASAVGDLHVWASGLAEPSVTGARYRSGVWDGQLMIVKVGADGQIKVRNTGTAAVSVYADVHGYWLGQAGSNAGATYVPLNTARIISKQTVAANSTASFPIVGIGGVPASGVAFVAITLIVKSTVTGKVTVYPSGSARPVGSNIEYRPSDYMSNLAIVAPGPDGKATFDNQGSAALTVYADISGYFAAPDSNVAGSTAVTVTPSRIVSNVSVAAGATYTVAPLGKGGVPASGVTAVGVNFTVKSTVANSLRVYPSDQTDPPGGGSVDFQPGDYWANLVLAKLGADGKFVVKNLGTAAATLYLDTYLYFAAPVRPSPPTHVTAVPGDAAATVSWQAPAGSGPAITGYTVTASPGGATATTTGATTATVSGLSNGTSYTFTVTASSASGTSAPSAASDPVMPRPASKPDRPFVTDVYARDTAVRVSWAPPADGGASLTKYVVTAAPGGARVETPPDATETIVPGLTNGTSYTFTVTAVNGLGEGQPSAPSNPVEPQPAQVPMTPPGLLAVPLDGRIDVQWSPAVDGGAPITGYTVTAQPGGTTVKTAPDTTAAALTGLANGTAYTVSVVAENTAGTSEAAVASAVTPSAARAPAAPTHVTVGTPAAGSAEVSWTAPADVGTSPITGYTVTASPGGKTVTSGTTTATITGLDPATAYTFTVKASNAAGAGPASAPTPSVVPNLTPQPGQPAPVMLTPAAVATLREVRGDGTLVFENPPAEVTGLTAGTLICLDQTPQTPEGMFARVLAVKGQSGLILVSTAQASLSDAYTEAGFALDTDIDTGDTLHFTPALPGVRLSKPVIKDNAAITAGEPGAELGIKQQALVAVLQYEHRVRGRTTAKIEGELEIHPKLKTNPSANASGRGTDYRASVKTKAELRVKGHVVLDDVSTPRLRLGAIKGPCFTVRVGRIPILVCLRFVVELSVELTSGVGVTYAVRYEKELGTQCHLGKATTCQGFSSGAGASLDQGLGVYGEAGITVSIPVDTQFLLWGVVGGGLVATPSVQFEADTTQSPWWEVRFALSLGVFVGMSSVGKDYAVYRNDNLIPLLFYTIAQGGDFYGIAVQPTVSRIDPGERLLLKAVVSRYPDDIPRRWRLVSGPGSLTPDGTYIADRVGAAEVEVVAPSDGSHPELTGRGVIVIGSGYGSPSEPLDDGLTHWGVNRLSVSWKPPKSAGTSPVLEYVVIARPADATAGATTTMAYGQPQETHTLLHGLYSSRPIDWITTVYARNAAGNSGPSQSVVSSPLDVTFPGPPYGDDLAIDSQVYPDPDTTQVAGAKFGAAISGDGRYVFFLTQKRSNLAPADVRDPAGTAPVILRKDTTTGQIVVASRGADGHTPSTGGFSDHWYVSRDGNVIAFTEANGRVIVHDIAAQTSWVLEDGAGIRGISETGQVVLYFKYLPTSRNNWDLYRQVKGGPPQKVTNCPGVLQPTCPGSFGSMSGDGTKVVWDDRATASGQGARTLLYDATTNNTKQLFGGADTVDPIISGDGIVVAVRYFDPSGSTGLVIRRTDSPAPGPADIAIPDQAAGFGTAIALNRDGRVLAYDWYSDYGEVAGERLYTYSASGTHMAGGSMSTWPDSAALTDDGRKVVYTLGHKNSLINVPGVWWDDLTP
ncbi:fibronectin type III domain-containing protein [Sphaerisporangium album]|nr:fibronectin type III domain-containing protein [Sphaerisporangium album]